MSALAFIFLSLSTFIFLFSQSVMSLTCFNVFLHVVYLLSYTVPSSNYCVYKTFHCSRQYTA